MIIPVYFNENVFNGFNLVLVNYNNSGALEHIKTNYALYKH